MRGLGLAVVLALAGTAALVSRTRPARHHRLEIRDAAFRPDTLRVAAGDTITWINHDIVPHTVTAEDGRWDSGEIAAGRTWTRIAREAGTVGYVCLYHPTMTGVLVTR